MIFRNSNKLDGEEATRLNQSNKEFHKKTFNEKISDLLPIQKLSKLCRRRSSVDSGIIVRTPSEKLWAKDRIIRTSSMLSTVKAKAVIYPEKESGYEVNLSLNSNSDASDYDLEHSYYNQSVSRSKKEKIIKPDGACTSYASNDVMFTGKELTSRQISQSFKHLNSKQRNRKLFNIDNYMTKKPEIQNFAKENQT